MDHQELISNAQDLGPLFAGRAATWDQERRYCFDNIKELRAAKIMGMTLPKAHGGQGASFATTARVVEAIARHCTLTARVVVEANMGGISAVVAYGTPEQKDFCAQYVLAGDKPAICITEPGAGSAATEMTTTARPDGDGWRLNGVKHWITGGGVSKLHLVFARVEDKDGAPLGIGGFLVVHDPENNAACDGFSVARRERTMGLCGMPEAELHFDNVAVPADRVLTPPGGFKRGFAELMTAYNSQRVGAGTIAMGVAAGALDHAIGYLKKRQQFGRPLAEFQGLQWMIAEMDAKVHASRLMLFEAAETLCSKGFPEMTMAARAKMFASENAISVVNDALQMFGARGYGDLEPLERMYRDVRMFTIGGGTAQVLKTQIAGDLLDMKTPQIRGGYLKRAEKA